jgi:hypothetical protein
MEIVALWNTFIAPSPINMGAVDKVIDTKMKQYMKGSSPSKRQRFTKEDFCQDWNTNKTFPLCSNTQSPGARSSSTPAPRRPRPAGHAAVRATVYGVDVDLYSTAKTIDVLLYIATILEATAKPGWHRQRVGETAAC